jgi:starch phosphorylase
VAQAFADHAGWARTATLNIARVGGFSSDRTVREYAEQIWRIAPLPAG